MMIMTMTALHIMVIQVASSIYCVLSTVISISELDVNVFKQKCQETLERKFILDWQNEIVDDSKHPILKTYKMFKSEFKFEPYLELLKDPKYIGLQFQSLELVRTCLKLNEVDTLDRSPQLKIEDVPSAMLSKMKSTLYWNAPLIKTKG